MKVWDGSEEYDPTPANWRFIYNSAESGGLSGDSPDSVAQAWIDAAIGRLETAMADDPLDPSNGGPGGRIHMLDDETLHLGWMWGRRGQSTEVAHYRHETRALIDAHTAFLLPYKHALVDALRARWPGERWFWYTVPFTPNKQPPYDASWPTESDEPPDSITDAEVAATDALLLSHADWVDGHCYLQGDLSGPGPLDTRAERVGWMTGNLIRKKGIADGLGKPFMARYWAYQSAAYTHPSIGVTEYEVLVEFFRSCVAAGVQHTSIDQGKTPFDGFASAAGMEADEFWRTYYVRAAMEAGFLRAGGDAGRSRRTTRNTSLGW